MDATLSEIHQHLVELGRTDSAEVLDRIRQGQFALGPDHLCATCGMALAVPGLGAATRRYCCHACEAQGDGHPVLPLAPRVSGVPGERTVETARAVFIAASPERVWQFLRDPDLVQLYDPRLERFQVMAMDPGGGAACVTVDGHFGVFPYHAEVHMTLRDGVSWRSTRCTSPLVTGLRGRYWVRAVDGGSCVTLVETLAFRGDSLAERTTRIWLPSEARALERQMRTLKRLIEDPGGVGELLRTHAPRQIPVDPRVLVWDPKSARPGRRGIFASLPSQQTVTLAASFTAGALAAVAAAVWLVRRRRARWW